MAKATWKKATLKSLCYRIGDGLHGTPEYSDSDIYFINGNNLENGAIKITENTKTVSEEELEKHHIPLNENTLLISINGTLGELGFYNGEKVMLGKSAAYLNFKSPINRFYFYYFQLPEIQKYFWNVATGSTIKNLSLKSLQDFEVPVPEEFEWKQISSILSSIDSKIELNNRINAELEALAKTIYDYWFVQFDFPISATQAAEMGNPALAGRPYKSSGGEMVWNEKLKREVPKGWEVKKIREIAKTGSGGTPLRSKAEYYENGNIPWINSGELNAPFIVAPTKFITTIGLQNSSAKLFEKGTLLMAMYGATAGKVSLLDFEACTNQAICAINPHDERLSAYLKFGLEDIYSYLVNLSSGSARDNLSQDKIKDLFFVIPADSVLSSFDQIASSCFGKVLLNLRENQELTSLRDWLLPMLMNGQVTVAEAKLTKGGEPKEGPYEEIGEVRVAAEGESPKYDKQ